MNEDRHNFDGYQDLRRKAEAIVERSKDDLPPATFESLRELVHELDVSRVELAMQNEELRRAQVELTETRDRYADLFDLAPIGYVVIDAYGRIQEINLTASDLLGRERKHLLRQPLASFILERDRQRFDDHLRQCFMSPAKVVCELSLTPRRAASCPVRLESVRLSGRREEVALCRTAILDLSDQRRSEAELRRRAEQLRKMSAELTQAEQKERRRLAHLLHDNVQQLLVAARYHLGILQPECDGTACRELIDKSDGLVSEAIAATRGLALDLSPTVVYEENMSTALEWLARRMKELHDLTVDLDLEPLEGVPEALRVFLFTAVQELLFNVVKHADARHATLTASRQGDMLHVTVKDGGRGFDPKAILPGEVGGMGGFGLFTIRERTELLGGELEINAKPGGGCTVTLVVPVPE